MSIVGFTGTRQGMTDDQKCALRKLLSEIARNGSFPLLFHHGDCVGSDEEAHEIAVGLDAVVLFTLLWIIVTKLIVALVRGSSTQRRITWKEIAIS